MPLWRFEPADGYDSGCYYISLETNNEGASGYGLTCHERQSKESGHLIVHLKRHGEDRDTPVWRLEPAPERGECHFRISMESDVEGTRGYGLTAHERRNGSSCHAIVHRNRGQGWDDPVWHIVGFNLQDDGAADAAKEAGARNDEKHDGLGAAGLDIEPDDFGDLVSVFTFCFSFWALAVSAGILGYLGPGEGALFRIDIVALGLLGSTAALLGLMGLYLLGRTTGACGDARPLPLRDFVNFVFAWVKVMGACMAATAMLAHANWLLALCFATCAASAFVLGCSSMATLLVKACGVSVSSFPLWAYVLLRSSRLTFFATFFVFALLEAGVIYFRETGHLEDLSLSIDLDLRRWELLLYISACGLVVSLFLAPTILVLRSRSLHRGDFADLAPAAEPAGVEKAKRPLPEEEAGEPLPPERRLEEGVAGAEPAEAKRPLPEEEAGEPLPPERRLEEGVAGAEPAEAEQEDSEDFEPDDLDRDPGLFLRVAAPNVAFCATVVSLMYLGVYGAGDDSKARVDLMAFFLSGSTALLLGGAFVLTLLIHRCFDGPSPNDKEWVFLLFAWLKAMGLATTFLALLGHQTWILALLLATCAAFFWSLWCGNLALLLATILAVEKESIPFLTQDLFRANRFAIFFLFLFFALLEAGAIYFKDEGHAEALESTFISELRRWELLLYTTACGMILSLVLAPLVLYRHVQLLRAREGARAQLPRGCRLFAMVPVVSFILHLNAVLFVPSLVVVLAIALPLGIAVLVLAALILPLVWLCQLLCQSDPAVCDDGPADQRRALKDAPHGVGGIREEAAGAPLRSQSSGLKVTVEMKAEPGSVQLLGVQAQEKVVAARDEAAPASAAHNEARPERTADIAAAEEAARQRLIEEEARLEAARQKKQRIEEARAEAEARLKEAARQKRIEEEEARLEAARRERQRMEEDRAEEEARLKEAARQGKRIEEGRAEEEARLKAKAQADAAAKAEEDAAARLAEAKAEAERERQRDAEEKARLAQAKIEAEKERRRRDEEEKARLAQEAARQEEQRIEEERAEEVARLKEAARQRRIEEEEARLEAARREKLRMEEERTEEEARLKEAARQGKRVDEGRAEEEARLKAKAQADAAERAEADAAARLAKAKAEAERERQRDAEEKARLAQAKAEAEKERRRRDAEEKARLAQATQRPPPEEGAGVRGEEPLPLELGLEEDAANEETAEGNAVIGRELALVGPKVPLKRDRDEDEQEDSEDSEPDVCEQDPGLCLRVAQPNVAFCATVVSLMYLGVYGAGDSSKARVDFMALFFTGSTGLALGGAFFVTFLNHRYLDGKPPKTTEWVFFLFTWLKATGLVTTLLALLGHQTWIPALLFAACAAFFWVVWCGSVALLSSTIVGVEIRRLPFLTVGLARASRLVLFVLFLLFALLEAGTIFFKDSGHADALGISVVSELGRWELLLYTTACGMILSLVLTPVFLYRRAGLMRARAGGARVPRGCRLFATVLLAAFVLHLNAVLFFPLLAVVLAIALPLGVVVLVLAALILLPIWLCQRLCQSGPADQRLALKDAPEDAGVREEAAGAPLRAQSPGLGAERKLAEPSEDGSEGLEESGSEDETESAIEKGDSSESDSNISDGSASVREAWPAMLRGIAAAAGVPEERVTFRAVVSKKNEHVSAMMQDGTSVSVEVHFEIAAAPAEIDSMRATVSAPDMTNILQEEVNQALLLDGTLRSGYQCAAVPSVQPFGIELVDDPVQAEKDMDSRRAAISARSNNTTQPLNSVVFLGTSSTLTAPGRLDDTGATNLPSFAAATYGGGASSAATASMPLGAAGAASGALRSTGDAFSTASPGPPNTLFVGTATSLGTAAERGEEDLPA